MAASADPPEHLAEILRQILALTGNDSGSCGSEDPSEEGKPNGENDKRDPKPKSDV